MKMKLCVMVVAVAATVAVFGASLDFAWMKGVTDKDPVSYKVGEKMVFTLTLEDVEGAIPEGEYFLDWKRSGDDGIRDGGKVALDGKPFVYETKIDKPGFVRIQANVVDKNGKQFFRKFMGDATTPEGKKTMNRFENQPRHIFFDGGAGADIEWVYALGYYDAANFAKRIPASCHTFVTRAGLGDYCCPPTGLAKLWNNVPGNKKIKWVQGSQHGYVPPKDYPGRDTFREAK